MAQWSSRAAWGARSPRGVRTDINPQGVAVHWYGAGSFARSSHAGCLQLVKAAQDMHMAIGNVNDIYYNLVACHHGYLIEARSTRSRPRVRGGANGNATSNGRWYSLLALWGRGDGQPSNALLQTLRDGIDWLRSEAGAANGLSGHRDHTSTECPGADLYSWARNGAPRPGGNTTPPPVEEDEDPMSRARYHTQKTDRDTKLPTDASWRRLYVRDSGRAYALLDEVDHDRIWWGMVDVRLQGLPNGDQIFFRYAEMDGEDPTGSTHTYFHADYPTTAGGDWCPVQGVGRIRAGDRLRIEAKVGAGRNAAVTGIRARIVTVPA